MNIRGIRHHCACGRVMWFLTMRECSACYERRLRGQAVDLWRSIRRLP